MRLLSLLSQRRAEAHRDPWTEDERAAFWSATKPVKKSLQRRRRRVRERLLRGGEGS